MIKINAFTLIKYKGKQYTICEKVRETAKA